MNKTLSELKKEFEAEENKKYKVELIVNSAVYGKKAKSQISDFYYLVLCLKKKHLRVFNNNNAPLEANLHLP